jgi:AcrR family transcriptional regulator
MRNGRAAGDDGRARIQTDPAAKRKAQTPPQRMRTNNPERTKLDILNAALEEFAAHGLSGARVDAIAERTQTSKRMIYYYFGGKLALYRAVLERSYNGIRKSEADLKLETLGPVDAIVRLIESTFDYDNAHPEFIRLVSIENVHRAKNLAKIDSIKSSSHSILATIENIVDRGRSLGVFRDDVLPIDIHIMISAFCFFRVSNRYTFGEIFSVDLSEAKCRERHKRMLVDSVLRFLDSGLVDHSLRRTAG